MGFPEFSGCILALTNRAGLSLASGWLGAAGVNMECCVCPWQCLCAPQPVEVSGTLRTALLSEISAVLMLWSVCGDTAEFRHPVPLCIQV